MSPKRYKVIDHTADIGLRGYGKDLKELFQNTAWGMFNLLADTEKVKPLDNIQISLSSSNREELLVDWLGELLYFFSAKKFLIKEIGIENLSDTSIESTGLGEKLDLSRHELRTEIKAVTYHQVKVEKRGQSWYSQVIFDV